MSIENPYAPPKAVVDDLSSQEPAPSLWNPNAAASWSLLFSPIFGSILHMKNWSAMGQPDKAKSSKNWAIGSTAFFVGLLVVSVALPESKSLDGLSRIASFALLITWYYAIGKSQNAFVLAKYGKGYPRRGWLLPLLIALGVFVVFIIAAAAIGFALGALNGAA